jgi:anti-sigma regulatory factor (Ser/Thr protein kinase)
MSGRTGATSRHSDTARAHSAGGEAGTVSGTAFAFVRGPGQSTAPAPVTHPHRQEMRVAGHWPLRTYLELGALPGAVPCARSHARQVLWEWGLDALGETVALIVSELVTNAVQASEGLIGSRYAGRWTPGVPPVRLWLGSDRQCIVILVWDGNHLAPKLQEAELDAESGRGLLLVESLSADWGLYTPESSSGKVVWAAVVAPRAGHAFR